MLISTLIGWRVAESQAPWSRLSRYAGRRSLLSYTVSRAWHRFHHAPWRAVVQRGLTPVTVGLVMAAATLLTEATSGDWAKGAVTAATAVVLLSTRVHPLILLGLGGALGAMGILRCSGTPGPRPDARSR